MSEIKTVTLHRIALDKGMLTRYAVEYTTGVKRIYGVPPDKVEKFIKENAREFTKVKYCFKAKED